MDWISSKMFSEGEKTIHKAHFTRRELSMKKHLRLWIALALVLGAFFFLARAQSIVEAPKLKILRKLNISPQFFNYLKQTKKPVPAARLRNMYFVRDGVSYIRLADRREIPLVSASNLIEAGGVSLVLPKGLTSYLEYIEGRGGKVPEYIDHRLVQSPIRDQRQRGTCVAHAIAASLEAFKSVPRDLSEEDIYHRFMMKRNSTCSSNDKDKAGYTITGAAKILSEEGACEERFWPYSKNLPPGCPGHHQPPQDAVKNRIFRIQDYSTIYSLGEWAEDKIALQAHNGRYVTVDFERKSSLIATGPGIGNQGLFTMVSLGGERVALLNVFGYYVSADANRNHLLVADRTSVHEWEKFTKIDLGGNKIALKAYNGRYVCADEGKDGLLYADRKEIKEWETFIVIDRPNRFSLSNLRYVESLLAAGYNIVWAALALWVDEDQNGVLDVSLDEQGSPLSPDENTGAHAMLIVGYYRPGRYFIVKNSWGDKWGDHHGYGYFSFDYLKTYSIGGVVITRVSGGGQ